MLKRLASSPDSVDRLVQALRTLADPTRLRLLAVLQEGERNVSSLCEELQLPQPTVSHHLGLLRSGTLVRNRRSGKQVFYALNDSVVTNLGEDGGVTIRSNGLSVHILTTNDPSDPALDDAGRKAGHKVSGASVR